ncbi:MAG TPA: Hpt domain-containing protein [Spongiibacteraceae bacterium]|jgi:HPt (histidine-containing phosphotransfer) domain-containing protein|nr:Hpt domain-containing protein [Spongiibacteraceae bacterium]
MSSTGSHVDAQALRELQQVMGNDFVLLIETFLNDSRIRLAAIDEAIAAGDSEALRRSAHSFKGSASNMAAPLLAELCQRLETLALNGEIAAAPAVVQRIRTEYGHVLEALQTDR